VKGRRRSKRRAEEKEVTGEGEEGREGKGEEKEGKSRPHGHF